MKNPIRRSFRHDFRLPFRRNTISGIITRYFTTLDSSVAPCINLNAYLPGSFASIKVSINVLTGYDDSETGIFTLSTEDGTERFTLSSSNSGAGAGKLKIGSSGFTPGSGNIDITDGVMHNLEFIINSVTGYYTVYIDGTVDYSSSTTLDMSTPRSLTIGAMRITAEGTAYQHFMGIIADVVVEVDDVVVVDLPLDAEIPENGVIPNNAFGNTGAPENATAINMTSTDSALYTYNEQDGNWEGQELVPWVSNVDAWMIGWSFDGILHKFDQDPYTYTLSEIVPVGNIKVVFEKANHTNGGPSLKIGTTNWYVSFITTADPDGVYEFIRFNSRYGYTLDIIGNTALFDLVSFSAKHIIEVPS